MSNERRCKETGCDGALHARAMCLRHYLAAYRRGELSPIRTSTFEERFWSKVEKTETCWLWTASLCDGYGQFSVSAGLPRRAHRVAYELLVGPIPEGLTLDHLCRVRNCVRPDHLEPVTQAENTRRASLGKTHCRQGHPYDEANTYIRPSRGERECRICRRESMKRWANGRA